MWILEILTKGGSVSDRLYFETKEEAEEEKKFYQSFYEKGYTYKVKHI